MATYSGVRIKHGTLAADTADVITLDGDYRQVEVVNRDGVAEIFFTVDGPDPAVEGDNNHMLPAAIGGVVVPANEALGYPTQVKLISSGAPRYTVRGM